MPNNFANNLKLFRKNLGLKQIEIAEKIGVAKSTYSQYENGQREPNVLTIKKIANVLNISGDELLGLDINNSNIKDLNDKYSQLDNYGKELIDTILELELKRVKNISP